jgi:DNA-binding YbaB/EbfC family protein
VRYRIKQPGADEAEVSNPAQFPRNEKIEYVLEPYVKAQIITPTEYIGNIMKQAKKMQEKMGRLQEELETKTIEAQAGGGMVRVVVNGKFELVSLKIEKEVVNPEDIEMLQDLIAAAVNEGIRKAQEMASSEMAKITGGLGIPGLGM